MKELGESREPDRKEVVSIETPRNGRWKGSRHRRGQTVALVGRDSTLSEKDLGIKKCFKFGSIREES